MATKKKPDEGGEGEGEEQPFTEAQQQAIAAMVNGAVGDHLKRKLPGIVETSIKKPLQEIRALLEGKQGGEGEGGEGEEQEETEEEQPRRPSGKGQPQRRAASGPDPALTQLQKKLAKVEAEREAEKREREAERQANRNKERDGTLRELLQGAGVDPNRLRGAVAVLREQTKYDDKNNEWLVAQGDDELDLATGVAAFVATDEGKAYLAPQQGVRPAGGQPQVRSGAGTRPNGGTARPTRPVASAADAKAAGKQQAAQELAAAVGSLLGNTVPLG